MTSTEINSLSEKGNCYERDKESGSSLLGRKENINITWKF